MECFNRFKRKMELNGGSIRNEIINNTMLLMNGTFDDDQALTHNIYTWIIGLTSYENEKQIRIRMYERKFSTANGTTIKFQTFLDTPIIIGDIVYDSEDNEYWLCTESFKKAKTYYQGKFTLCNWILKWQDKKGNILEYPCFDLNSTQYNSGERANAQFSIGSSQHMIKLPCDDNTVILESPQRFYLDKNTINPTSYIVTQNDTSSYNYGDKGLVVVTLTECVNRNDTDRPDLGICDYIEIIDTEDSGNINPDSMKAIIKFDSTIIKSGGSSKNFVAEFYNGDLKVNDIVPVWKIICDFKDELEVNESNNLITIQIDNDNYIDEEFKLVLSDSNNTCETSLIIKIDSLW